MNKTEALKLAQVLEEEAQDNPDDYRWKAANFIRKTLAKQPASARTAQQGQEPVAIVDSTISGHINWLCTFFPEQGTKLYPPPPKRKRLTREQVREMMTEAGYDTASSQERADFINGIRHGEAAIVKGEKK